MKPDCRFEEYFLPDTPETMFGDEALQNLLDAFTVHGPWHGTGGELADPNLSTRQTQSGGIPAMDSMTFTLLCQLMFTTTLKIAPGFPIHVVNRTR